MANTLKTLDSVGGFSINKDLLVDESKNLKNINSLEVKSSFFADSATSHYIMRGVNASVLSVDDVSSTIEIGSNTINFIEAHIIGVNDSGAASISKKIESAVYVDNAGQVTEMSSMETTIKDSIPNGQTWTVSPFTSGSANRFSYQTTRIGTTLTIKWVAYVKVVSIAWQ